MVGSSAVHHGKMWSSALTRSVSDDTVAVCGGEATGTGAVCPEACLWESVTEPSSLGHMMTRGVSFICGPNPLMHVEYGKSYPWDGKVNVHRHPAKLVQGFELVCKI